MSDMIANLIHRVKNIQEFVVTVDVPEDFRFNGQVPFDMTISDNVISAKVWGLDFDEAVNTFSSYLETCK